MTSKKSWTHCLGRILAWIFFFLENVAIQFSVGSLLPRYLSFNAFSSFTSHCGHNSQLLSKNYDVFLPNKILKIWLKSFQLLTADFSSLTILRNDFIFTFNDQSYLTNISWKTSHIFLAKSENSGYSDMVHFEKNLSRKNSITFLRFAKFP